MRDKLTPEDAVLLIWDWYDRYRRLVDSNDDAAQDCKSAALKHLELYAAQAVEEYRRGLWRPIEEAPLNRVILVGKAGDHGVRGAVVFHTEKGRNESKATHFIDPADLGKPGGQG